MGLCIGKLTKETNFFKGWHELCQYTWYPYECILEFNIIYRYIIYIQHIYKYNYYNIKNYKKYIQFKLNNQKRQININKKWKTCKIK